MGVVETISASRWPKQGAWLGCRTEVFFHYDSSQSFGGTIVRDDAEAPHRTIIQLDDGRLVLTTECQHSHPQAPASPVPGCKTTANEEKHG